MLTRQALTQLLHDNGYKGTPQRLAVYEALAAERWHPSAEELCKRVKQKYPSMSFATVYKAVELLQRINAVRILSTEESCFRYDADMSDHHHLQCTHCGSVEDVYLPNMDTVTKRLEKSSGYDIHKRQFYFFGLCPKCRTL